MIALGGADILRCIEGNLESKVLPHVSAVEARSAIATSRHLLRHVALRIELEGQILFDEIAALRSLLPRVATVLGAEPAAAIHAALTKIYRAPTEYPSLSSMAGEAGALREALYAAQKLLIAAEEGMQTREDYAELRVRIKDYIVSQIERERQLVDPAFFGFGPRR